MLEDMEGRGRQELLLHPLTVKLTETFPALRQAAEEKKKRHLAVCPTQRIDDEQHVDTVAPFIHRTYGVKNHLRGDAVVEERSHGTGRQAQYRAGTGSEVAAQGGDPCV